MYQQERAVRTKTEAENEKSPVPDEKMCESS